MVWDVRTLLVLGTNGLGGGGIGLGGGDSLGIRPSNADLGMERVGFCGVMVDAFHVEVLYWFIGF